MEVSVFDSIWHLSKAFVKKNIIKGELKMKRVIALILMILMVLVAVCTGCSNKPATSEPGETKESQDSKGIWPTDVVIYGGTVGGSWNLATTVIGNFLTKEIDGIRTTMSPGTGFGNVAGVQSGAVTFAMSQLPTAYDGVKGVEPFEGPQDKIRNVAYIYVEPTHLVVNADSDIYSLADMKGKTIGTFAPGNTAENVTRQLLSLYDLSYDNVKTSFGSASDLAEQFKDGIIDMMSFAGAMPYAPVMDINSVRSIRLLSLPEDKLAGMKEINPAFFKTIIPAGTYEGYNEDVVTIGAIQHLICSSDLDEEFVYQVTKAMVENIDQIREAHVAFAPLTPEDMAKDVGIPFHPGAERYYREAGLIK